jgi:hypothetical protein
MAGLVYKPGMSERDEKRGGLGCAIAGMCLFSCRRFMFWARCRLAGETLSATEYSLGIIYFPLMALA